MNRATRLLVIAQHFMSSATRCHD